MFSRSESVSEPTIRTVKARRERIRSLAELTQQEKKLKKKAIIAHSDYWKRKHRKEWQRFRSYKYTEPLEDPLDFSSENFSNELSSKVSHKVTVIHDEVVRFRGTFYTGIKKNDDILICHEAYHTDGLVPIRGIHRGLSPVTMHFLVMDRMEYGHGEYKLIVE